MNHRYMIAMLALLCAPSAIARPVSYPGGWTLMQDNDERQNSALVHYTVNRHYALGLKWEQDRADDTMAIGPQLNWLIHRTNGEGYQANLYAFASPQAVWKTQGASIGSVKPGAMLSVSADWENRRWMVMTSGTLKTSAYGSQYMQMGRVAVAPYIGDYGDLHSWIIAEVHARTNDPDSVMVAGLVRFFYKTFLLEVGATDRGDPIVNWILRF